MRTLAQLTALALMLAFAGSGQAQQTAPASSAPATSGQSSTAPSAPAQDSLAEAARKAREQRKEKTKSPRVFTNDNIPASGGISSVGAPAPTGSSPGEGTEPSTPAASSGRGEKFWRDKFADLRHKLEQDQQNLALSQRELGTLNTQFYTDPNKQLQQQLSRSDIDKKTAEIDKAKAQVDADQQAISDAEDNLRKSGGDPGWAR